MKRLLRVSLLAYPAAVRRQDGDHLLDLASEIAADSGVLRQALSLVRGGLAMRLEKAGSRQLLTTVVAVGVLALVGAVVGVAITGGTTTEVEARSCVGSCADVRAWARSRELAGWSCTRMPSTRPEEWRCVA